MSKQYLRISDTWTLIFSPAEHTRFMVNVSGISIQLKTSTSPSSNPASIAMPGYTVGGTIGQITFRPDEYVYAKASVGTGIAIWDTEPISLTDSRSIGDQIDQLALEVMKLSQRVTANEIKHVEHASEFYQLQRHFLSHALHSMENDAQLFNYYFTLSRRLFAAENYIRTHGSEYAVLREDVDNLIENTGSNEELSKLAIQLSALTQTVNNLVNKVSILDGITGDDAQQTIESLAQLTAQVNTVAGDLNSLNNALVTMSSQNTPEEIAAAGEQLKTAEPKLSNVVDGLVTTLTSLANKVDYRETVILGTDIDGITIHG